MNSCISACSNLVAFRLALFVFGNDSFLVPVPGYELRTQS